MDLISFRNSSSPSDATFSSLFYSNSSIPVWQGSFKNCLKWTLTKLFSETICRNVELIVSKRSWIEFFVNNQFPSLHLLTTLAEVWFLQKENPENIRVTKEYLKHATPVNNIPICWPPFFRSLWLYASWGRNIMIHACKASNMYFDQSEIWVLLCIYPPKFYRDLSQSTHLVLEQRNFTIAIIQTGLPTFILIHWRKNWICTIFPENVF